MLNNFDRSDCPLCKVPLCQGKKEYKENNYYCNRLMSTGDYCHVILSSPENKKQVEEIAIGKYLLCFETEGLKIYEVVNGRDIPAADIRGSDLLLKDLLTEDKIQEIVKNYKILG